MHLAPVDSPPSRAIFSAKAGFHVSQNRKPVLRFIAPRKRYNKRKPLACFMAYKYAIKKRSIK
jgi:hypothetical protein